MSDHLSDRIRTILALDPSAPALEYEGDSQDIDDEIADCEDELDKAQDEIDDKDYDKAIDKFKKAWEHAQEAIELGEG